MISRQLDDAVTERIKAERRPRKTSLDKAIDALDVKLAGLRGEIKALELARQHLVEARIANGPRP